MTRLACVALVGGAMCVATAPDAVGQTGYLLRAVPNCSGCPAPTLIGFDIQQGRVTTIPLPGLRGGGVPYITPDGGLMVLLTENPSSSGSALLTHSLVVRDLRSGAMSMVPATAQGVLAGSPTRPEVYAHDTTGAVALSAVGARRFRDFTCAPLLSVATSGDGSRVLFNCGNTPGYVFDTQSGATLMTLPAFADSHGLSPDGRTLFSVVATATGRSLRRYDVESGLMNAEIALSDNQFRLLFVDPRTGRVFVTGAGGVFDPQSLQRLALAVLGEWAFDSGASRAVVWSDAVRIAFGTTIVTHTVTALETDSFGTTFVTSWETLGSDDVVGIVLASRPAAPAALSATTQGASVSLAWAGGGPAAAVTRFVLEVGSAPGLNDIFTGLDVGLQTSLSASAVPPGRYYVRLRAANYTGLSAPSNEIVVTVP